MVVSRGIASFGYGCEFCASYSSTVCTGGGLYCEAGSAYLTMSDAGLPADVSTYNSLIEAFARGGLFDDAIEVSRDMEEARCPPNRLTYEALMGVYCAAGLFDEAKAQFLDLKVGGGVPSVDAYCLMLSVCARRNRYFVCCHSICCSERSNRIELEDVHTLVLLE